MTCDQERSKENSQGSRYKSGLENKPIRLKWEDGDGSWFICQI